jgi:hypothetical protein
VPQVRAIEARAAELIGVPAGQVEPLQVVSYRDGQRFTAHHDAGTVESDGEADDGSEEEDTGNEEAGGGVEVSLSSSRSNSGSSSSGGAEGALPKYKVSLVAPRRLVTFFVYLNTLPPGVGATEFPALGLAVQPRARTALLFCNVNPDGTPDPRAVHAAQPVGEGFRKFGLNLWVTDTSCLEYASATGSHSGVVFKAPKGFAGVGAAVAPQVPPSPETGGAFATGSAVAAGSLAAEVCDLSSSSGGSVSSGWEGGPEGGPGSGGVLAALERFEMARQEVRHERSSPPPLLNPTPPPSHPIQTAQPRCAACLYFFSGED